MTGAPGEPGGQGPDGPDGDPGPSVEEIVARIDALTASISSEEPFGVMIARIVSNLIQCGRLTKGILYDQRGVRVMMAATKPPVEV